MKKTLIFITLIILLAIPFTYASNDFSYNRLFDDVSFINDLNDIGNVNITNAADHQVILYNQTTGDWYNSYLNNSAHHVNASDYWITNIGSLSGVNATQFNNLAGVLNIDEVWVDSNWCRLTGCTMQGTFNLDANDIINVGNLNFSNGFIQNPNYVQFNTSWANGNAEGRLQWNTEDGTLEVGMPGGNVNLQIGQEMLIRAKNTEPVDITNCQAVWVSDATGGIIEIMTPIASNISQAPLTFALATETIPNNQLGYVTLIGLVRGCDTSAWNAGDVLYLSATEEGNLTNVAPVAPNTKVIIGIVTRVSSDEGIIATNPTVVQRLITSSDLYPVGLTDASIIRYNSTSSRFEISTSYTTDEVDELIGGASLELYFKNSSSGISTYWDMNQSANGAPKNSTSITLSADSTQIGGFISPNASDMGIAGLSNGIIDSHFHANVDLVTGKKTVNGYFEVYQRYSNGTEIFLTRSHLVEVDATAEQEYEAHAALLDEVVLNDSDRIIMKLFANLSGSGGNPVLTTYIQGDTLARGDFSSLGVNFLTKGEAERTYFRLDGDSIMQGNANIGDFNLTNVSYGFFNDRVGIGTADPQAVSLHLWEGDSGATVFSGADNFIIEHSGSAGMSILTGNTQNGEIAFGDPENNRAGKITYVHASDSMRFNANGVSMMAINDGAIGIGANFVTPDSSLHIRGSGTQQIKVESTSGAAQIVLDRAVTASNSAVAFPLAGANQWIMGGKPGGTNFAIRSWKTGTGWLESFEIEKEAPAGSLYININGDVIAGGNITAQALSWGGGYITSNATCSYLRYNATGFLKESECP